ncbi:hypothetical protein [Leptospira levettii]|uniref:hypothetical protein n=1 Tax=Leptospira levettii TaxID=2023178 RepID=UPI000C2AC7D5|nr:hypothetical protein [Leptospira levettii]PJZ89049.1 hypothetical protein CH368_08465 [Leptospira levettii]
MEIEFNRSYVAIDEENFEIAPRSILRDMLSKKEFVLCSILNKGADKYDKAMTYLAHLSEGSPVGSWSDGMKPFIIEVDQFLNYFRRAIPGENL